MVSLLGVPSQQVIEAFARSHLHFGRYSQAFWEMDAVFARAMDKYRAETHGQVLAPRYPTYIWEQMLQVAKEALSKKLGEAFWPRMLYDRLIEASRPIGEYWRNDKSRLKEFIVYLNNAGESGLAKTMESWSPEMEV